MKTDPTFWILARASGFTAYFLLAASVLAGLVLKSRPFRSLKPAAVTDTHRFLALLGLGAIVFHGLTIALDRTIRMPLAGLLVPGASPYRPVAVALGVLAAELMVLVYASFALRKRIGVKNWRRLHWFTYGIFGAATLHGLTAGTDTGRPWAFAIYLAAAGCVAFAAGWRAFVPPIPATARRTAQ
jgi:sulfoxide reductase heme-binding subunit YedZ